MKKQSNDRFLVLSTNTVPQISAPVNHARYCERHGYDYLFDATPYPLKTPFDQKLTCVLKSLKRFSSEWLFWIDDDAYFMQMDRPLDQFVEVPDDVFMVICASPVTAGDGWSAINSGLFFLRNCEASADFIQSALDVNHKDVEQWWDKDVYGNGYRAGGDQLRLFYIMEKRQLIGNKVSVVEATSFNARPYHFVKDFDDQFICHLANTEDKLAELKKMQARFNLNKYLLANDSADEFRWSVFSRYGEKKSAVHDPRRLRPDSIKNVKKILLARFGLIRTLTGWRNKMLRRGSR